MDEVGVRPGEWVLDLGCGFGRHAFEVARRGAHVVALDASEEEVRSTHAMFQAMRDAAEIDSRTVTASVRADATALPFPDHVFDRVICSEMLEHVRDDQRVLNEIARVTRPGGRVALTVPRWFPELVNWALSDAYHEVEGGHIRIYRRSALDGRVRSAGLLPVARHHSHALHTPYWWLKCLVGVSREDHLLVRAYHRMLVWDIMKRPRTTRYAETLLNPVLGKSWVLYAEKPPIT
ncbi:MAG: class I SAM-dependent methyltransferase [Acidimicrobiaceae bacterium]|nr:class I SAM-dependent methyltransferase [Acidimicrobiaceae bacterium]